LPEQLPVIVETPAPLILPEIVVHAPVPAPPVQVPTVPVVVEVPRPVLSGIVTQAHCEAAVRGLGVDWRWAMALAQMESAGDGAVGHEALTRTEVHVFRRRLTADERALAGTLASDGVRGRTNLEVHAWSRRWLVEASRIDAEKAAASCSYGAWQIMGFNCEGCGFTSARAMLAAMDGGIEAQALALREFLRSGQSLVAAMRAGNVAAVGVGYNGPGNGNTLDGRPNPDSHYNAGLRGCLIRLGVLSV
jgi:hypothetical protein